MDAAHLHLMLNHFPIVGAIFAIPLLLIAWVRRSDQLTITGLLLVVITAVLSYFTFLTGEPAEEIVEHLPGMSKALIEAHEEAGEKAIWIIAAAGVAAFAGLLLRVRNKATPRWLVPLVIFLTLCSVLVLGWTNNLGGQISHPEIRKAESTAGAEIAPGRANEEKQEHEEED